jgi:hypothetical protein
MVYKYDNLNRLTDIWYSFTGTLVGLYLLRAREVSAACESK